MEKTATNIDIKDELKEIKAVTSFLHDSVSLILDTCLKGSLNILPDTPFGIGLVFDWLNNKIDVVRDTMDACVEKKSE